MWFLIFFSSFEKFQKISKFRNLEIFQISKFQNRPISVENFLDQKFSTNKISGEIKFFSTKNFWWTFFWTPNSMSIQNFPRIPKIILRNPCGESKGAKKQFKHYNQVWRSGKNSTGTLAPRAGLPKDCQWQTSDFPQRRSANTKIADPRAMPAP